MDWLFLIIGTSCFVTLFIHLHTLTYVEQLKLIPLKVLEIVRSPRISDHWKEKALPRYSLQLLRQSLTIFTLFCVSFSPFIVFSLISEVTGGQFVSLASSVQGIAVSSVVAILFWVVLSRKSKADYGATSRILHQMVLGSSFFGETLFDIEKALHGSKGRDVSGDNHVFVAGLARAGTTILMRTLYENGNFCSLTYRDMPFILAPNSWKSLSQISTKKSVKQERAHGDGIVVNYDSPEALEEVFWRTFSGSDYIKRDCLVPMTADSTVVADFRTYVSLVLKTESNKRYLSKNNNNILRLESITKAFPRATIIVPFRAPLQQAFSLRNQHRKFEAEDDPFTQKYMTWLAHHEFGADHRQFLFDEEKRVAGDTENLEYWLELWIKTYSYLLENLPEQAIFLSYERLCDDTEYVWSKLTENLNIDSKIGSNTFSKSLSQVEDSVSEELTSQVNELYEKLVQKSIGCQDN